MAMGPAAGARFNMQEISDERLQKLLERTEFELGNEVMMRRFPSHARTVKERYQKIIEEMHKREFNRCLEEIKSLQEFKETKRDLVVQWLNKINIDDIKPLQWKELEKSKKSKRGSHK